MTIHITHEKEVFVGRVVYNFTQISDVVLITFDKPIDNDNINILLKFDENLKTWIDEEGVYKNNPIFFGQILNKLHKLLKSAHHTNTTA
jgi:hypothetical protein